MAFELNDKVALVTGGGSGIGESICKTFARAGARVYVLDIDKEKAERVAAEIKAGGGKAEGLSGNVSQQGDVIQLCQGIVNKAGRLDILINNAGIAHVGTLESTSEKDLDSLYAVNIKGVYNGMFAAIPHMKEQGGGVIINMGSIASSIGLPGRFGYSMTKGAVENMTYTVARDYIDYHIRCNSIAPARIHTPFVDGFLARNYPGKEEEMFEKLSKTQPIGRMGQPAEVAHLAQYLCSDEASFITGTNFPIDGGFLKLNT